MAAQEGPGGLSQARVTPLSEDPVSSAWQRFSSAGTAQAFCQGWLAMQCQLLPNVRAGLVVLQTDAGDFAPAARWTTGDGADGSIDHLSPVVEKALRSETGLIEAVPTGGVAMAYPVRIKSDLFGAVVIELATLPSTELRRAFVTMSWGAGWLEVLFRRRQSDSDGAEVKATRMALDLTVAAMEQETAKASAMALVNEVVEQLGARSAALALSDGRKLKLLAFSRTAWFQRRSHLAASTLEAMEETIDQLRPVSFPEIAGTDDTIHVAHKRLAELSAAGTMLSVPLMAAGKPVGALLLEFDASSPPATDAALLLEAVGAISGSTLADKQRQDRLFSGRVPRWLGAFWRDLTNPRRFASKVLLALGLAGLVWLVTAQSTLRVTSDAVVEGTIQRAIVAPIDGFLDASDLRPGDIVSAGDVVAELDDRDLRLEVLRLESERNRAESEYRDALAQQDSIQMELLRSAIEEIDAQLQLTQLQSDRLTIRAPIDGVIVSGDLTRMLGTPIEKGQQLFEIAPLGSYRVVLKVDERDVLLMEPGQTGLLSLEAISGGRLPIEVVSVTPVSTPEEGRNYFRVEAEISQNGAPLRPGMEGVGKVEIEEAPLVWTWTRPLINWLKIKAWAWLP